jgi:hypothetical protein
MEVAMVKVTYLGLSRDKVKAEFGAIRDRLIKLSMNFHPGWDEHQSIQAVTAKVKEAADLIAQEKDFLLPKMDQSRSDGRKLWEK